MYVLFGTHGWLPVSGRGCEGTLELSAFLSSEAFPALALTKALPWEGLCPFQQPLRPASPVLR
jgi:hypothetical protein